jgi:hypothetical protein
MIKKAPNRKSGPHSCRRLKRKNCRLLNIIHSDRKIPVYGKNEPPLPTKQTIFSDNTVPAGSNHVSDSVDNNEKNNDYDPGFPFRPYNPARQTKYHAINAGNVPFYRDLSQPLLCRFGFHIIQNSTQVIKIILTVILFHCD